ncbi:MAG: S46 family peptidase [Rikenellaceae bacterium]|nr:S46 family peptidase [Rikenellaceae bacterium]
MKKILLLFAVLFFAGGTARADEGMWLLPALQKMNIRDMQDKGLKISAEEIYSANNNSLKDAIVIFANGCTGEIVSPQGLLFTNHHCGYGAIQALSTLERDILKNGYWATDLQEELPAPGHTVTFIRHIEDVTGIVLEGIDTDTPQGEREAAIEAKIKEVTEEYGGKEEFAGMNFRIAPFYGGNQYILFVMEIYRDIRLVGTPPNSIGKFGGDTDNWMWPRHTGDFSIFRVYADADGKPAEYSPENVPYQAPVHLDISIKGFQEGDFAMIMGFPGSTQRYMTSFEIDEMLEMSNPNRILIRGKRQDILWDAMINDDAIRIKYAAKYAGSSNYWKNSIGMSRGVEKLGVKSQKEAQEEAFLRWVAESPSRAKYSPALDYIREAVESRRESSHTTQYIGETLTNGVELLRASTLAAAVADGRDTISEAYINRIVENSYKNFYKDYDAQLDKKVARVMIPLLKKNIDPEWLPSFYETIDNDFEGDADAYIDYLYDSSLFTDHDKFTRALRAGDYESIENDPAVAYRTSIMDAYASAGAESRQWAEKFREGHRLYVEGLLEMYPDRMNYPDANFTIRLTYGNILPYRPADGVIYDYYTTLAGVMEKEDDSNPEFVVPAKLKELYENRDFGPYGQDGYMPVCFLSNNDITGGNSGSPVLDGEGNLIGLAFDGNWEAMSGDIAFEPDLQRCINVDVRYVLFIIDKFAGSSHIMDELTIVR